MRCHTYYSYGGKRISNPLKVRQLQYITPWICCSSQFFQHPLPEQSASSEMPLPTILTKVLDAVEATYTGLLKFTARVVSSPVFPSRLC
jgi:hypothetical protein